MKTITEKLINLGFSENENCFEKYVQKLGDRFGYSIIYDKEQGAFLFIKYTRTEKIIDEEEILLNHNNLSSGIKEEWLRIKKELEHFKIKFYSFDQGGKKMTKKESIKLAAVKIRQLEQKIKLKKGA